MGNLDSERDWGHAKDYVRGMWLILQQEQPDDFVLATGETHNIRSFVESCFAYKGISLVWEGEGLREVGKDEKTGKIIVKINKKYFRPNEVDLLLGDASKAEKQLGWTREYDLDMLIDDMMMS